MKKQLLVLVGIAVAVAGAGLSLGAKPPPPPPPAPPPPYSLQMLDNSFEGTSSTLEQLNDLGDAIGYAEDATGGTVAFVTTPESREAGIDMISLRQLLIDGGYYVPLPDPPPGTPPDPDPGLPSGWAINDIAGINNLRQIAATATLVENDEIVGHKPIRIQLAVTNGVVSISALDDLSSPFTDAHEFHVVAVNNQGDILGHALVPDPAAAGQTVWHLILYSPEVGWSDLGTVDPGVSTLGGDLSDRDASASVYVVGNGGFVEGFGNWRLQYNIPLAQTDSLIRFQGTYSRNPYAFTFGVNASGQVAGLMSTGRSDERAFLYDGTMKNLGNLTSANSWNDSWANAVNSSGDTAGGSFTGSVPGNTGLLYVYSRGKTYDMANCLNAADKAVYQSLVAGGRSDSNDLADINASGVISGPGLGVSGNYNIAGKRAYLLIPVNP
jgi:probable HAF family extracellular repeat protein